MFMLLGDVVWCVDDVVVSDDEVNGRKRNAEPSKK